MSLSSVPAFLALPEILTLRTTSVLEIVFGIDHHHSMSDPPELGIFMDSVRDRAGIVPDSNPDGPQMRVHGIGEQLDLLGRVLQKDQH
jgi:hypothetical protein